MMENLLCQPTNFLGDTHIELAEIGVEKRLEPGAACRARRLQRGQLFDESRLAVDGNFLRGDLGMKDFVEWLVRHVDSPRRPARAVADADAQRARQLLARGIAAADARDVAGVQPGRYSDLL